MDAAWSRQAQRVGGVGLYSPAVWRSGPFLWSLHCRSLQWDADAHAWARMVRIWHRWCRASRQEQRGPGLRQLKRCLRWPVADP